jgi:hypothetical protein
MVEQFKKEWQGELLTGSGYVTTQPRKWTKNELEWCLKARDEGKSLADIAQTVGRSEVSVFVKLKRHSKNVDTYNHKFRDMKYQANHNYAVYIQPKNVLDVYAGKSWWQDNGYKTTTNDKDTKYACDYNLDALALLATLWLEGKKYDVVDLDPFGSAYECLDFAFRMAKRGVVVSFGEWGHKRWRRVDFVSHRYGIETLDDFVEANFIREAQRIARRYKKEAIVVDTLQYSNFLRVYFDLQPFKEVSQWK